MWEEKRKQIIKINNNNNNNRIPLVWVRNQPLHLLLLHAKGNDRAHEGKRLVGERARGSIERLAFGCNDDVWAGAMGIFRNINVISISLSLSLSLSLSVCVNKQTQKKATTCWLGHEFAENSTARYEERGHRDDHLEGKKKRRRRR